MRRREFLQSLTGCLGAACWGVVPALASRPAATSRWLNPESSTSAENSKTAKIYCNQIGFQPQARKVATVVSSGANAFQVRSAASGAVIQHASLSLPQYDLASGDSIQTADFSTLQAPGSYVLASDNGLRSGEFRVGAEIYREPLWLTMRAFYGQRCGCNVDLGHGYEHPTCHREGAFHPTSGRSGKFANHGGWHDAGDYGRYIVNSGISTGTLLWAWEFYAPALHSLDLRIPESGGKTPDFLAEIQWNLNWMLALQDADGGVWQKQASEQFCPFVMPQDDLAISYVIGTGFPPYKSTCATADLAAVAAIAARCYAACDPAFAQSCLVAARKAWKWCVRNPNVLFKNPAGIGTGEYGDSSCHDEFAWASAELWRTTGESDYERAFLASLPQPIAAMTIHAPSWNNLTAMACWTYALAERNSAASVVLPIEQATLKSAEQMVRRGAANGYGNTLSLDDYIWGSNGVAANHSLLLLVADRIHPDRSFRDAAVANLDYVLGRNCFGLSWITHLGSNPFMNPHHRPSVADHIAAPWPGLMSGGPNAHPADPVARLLPRLPPMRSYIDDHGAYSCNEVAINWNAPLVFALAAVN